MKKLLCLILVCSFVFSLTACGSKVDNDVNEPTTSTNSQVGAEAENNKPSSKYNLQYQEGYEHWGTTNEIEKPTISALTWDVNEIDGKTVYKTNTALSFDKNTIFEKFKNNEFCKSLTNDFYTKEYEYHNGESTMFGKPYTIVTVTDYVYCTDVTNKIYISACAQTDIDQYNDWGSILLTIENIPIDKFSQDEIYVLAQYVFGDYADFLVYSEDLDGLSKIDDDPNYKTKNVELAEYVKYEDSAYVFLRTVTKGEKENTVTVKLSIKVAENGHFESRYKAKDPYLPKDHSNIYEENNYTPAAVLPSSFGDSNPMNAETFGVAGISKNLEKCKFGHLGEWYMSKSTHEDGTTTFSLFIQNFYTSKVNSNDSQNFEYFISVKEKDNVVQELDFRATMNWSPSRYNIEIDSQAFVDKSITIMEDLFEIDIPTITYDKNKASNAEITLNINGVDYPAKFAARHNAVDCQITIDYEK